MLETRNPEQEQLGIFFEPRTNPPRNVRLLHRMMLQCVKFGKTLLSGQALPTHTDFASNEAPLIQASFYWPLRDGK
ncbi:hypothetical protein [Mesorhizobium sp.]|uniref:hypothetical protein n=1 Tax=Mesorhizobium sp. TaxID=1871066 RepID=UPI0012177F54|nr:hypothetical protein [Mesorhizobium sp.]TIN28261.1 MAG: hypothetical protein E5Y19_07585 [Mesorhizobium sp.]TJU81319.1 MAG: hypothetical protein E5Y15_21035 [Mesorhizobium sp.]